MKAVIFAIFSSVVFTSAKSAAQDDLSWFSSPELIFDTKKQSISNIPTPINENHTTPTPIVNKSSLQRKIESIERLDLKKTNEIPDELKKCKSIFRAQISPSENDLSILQKILSKSKQDMKRFNPKSISILFSTNPLCLKTNKGSQQIEPLLDELRQLAARGGL